MNAREGNIERAVEEQLAIRLPDVDLREVRLSGGRDAMLSVVIDRAGGVDHDLCSDVTAALDEIGLRDQFGIEVSSPGPEPPLRTPEHFGEVVGQRVRLRLERPDARARDRTGTLVAVDDDSLTVDFGDGGPPTQVPLASVKRARALDNEDAPVAGARGGATP